MLISYLYHRESYIMTSSLFLPHLMHSLSCGAKFSKSTFAVINQNTQEVKNERFLTLLFSWTLADITSFRLSVVIIAKSPLEPILWGKNPDKRHLPNRTLYLVCFAKHTMAPTELTMRERFFQEDLYRVEWRNWPREQDYCEPHVEAGGGLWRLAHWPRQWLAQPA